MRLQDIMSTNIKTIAPGATVADARNRMRLDGIHHLLVLDRRQIVGVVSDRDLGGRVAARGGNGGATSIADVMSDAVVTATTDTTVRQAANLMRGRGIGCLAVVDGDKPVGILTTTDLLELIGRGAERPIEHSKRWTLPRRGARDAGPSTRHGRRS
jgi:acetoin utilization protein AcuB